MSASPPQPSLDTTLNVDILLHVALYLPFNELHSGFARCSRLMYAVANDDYVWSNIRVDVKDTATLLKIAQQHPSVAHIYCVLGLERFTVELAEALPNLRTAVGFAVTDPVLDTLEWSLTALARCPGCEGIAVAAAATLTSLDMNARYATAWTASPLVACTNLTRLIGVNETFFRAVPDAFPLLSEIRAHFPNVPQQPWENFVAAHPALTRLTIDGRVGFSTKVFPVNLVSLELTTINSHELNTLCCANRGLHTIRIIRETVPLVPATIEALGNHGAIRWMSGMSFANLEDDEVATFGSTAQLREFNVRLRPRHVALMLPALRGLEKLPWFIADDTGIAGLGEHLSSLRTLEIPYPLSDESYEIIGAHATHVRTLQILKPVSPAADAALAPMAAGLTKLVISLDNVDCEFLQTAAAAGPTCKYIQAYHSTAIAAFLERVPDGTTLDTIVTRASDKLLASALEEFCERGGRLQQLTVGQRRGGLSRSLMEKMGATRVVTSPMMLSNNGVGGKRNGWGM